MKRIPDLLSIPGLRLGTACAGIRQAQRPDLVVMDLAPGTRCGAVFTRNAFCAAPVRVARANLSHSPRWLVINSGNANAGLGSRGLQDARRLCAKVAALTGGKPEQVLPFSTGVIGEPLPVDKIEQALPEALKHLSESGWQEAAGAILTTDTIPKGLSCEVGIEGKPVRITGICKGAGMIHPNMATMLAFVATDADLPAALLQHYLELGVDSSFHCITVDGDTSTNDACVLMATGTAGVTIKDQAEEHDAFRTALQDLLAGLAEQIVRDGEGATKLVRIRVTGAVDSAEARHVGKTIAHSPLVKTAFFAGDPNWGRILAAVGRAGLADLDIGQVCIWLGQVCIVRDGARSPDYREEAAARVMAGDEFDLTVSLGRGDASETVLTCDLSYDYVRINAEYRT